MFAKVLTSVLVLVALTDAKRVGKQAPLQNGALLLGGDCGKAQFVRSTWEPVEVVDVDLVGYRYSAAASYKGRVYVTGGTTWPSAHFPNFEVQIYDKLTGEVSEAEPMLERRAYHTATTFQDRIVVCGGKGVKSRVLNTCEAYNPYTDTWEPMSYADLPLGVYGHGAAVLNDKMYLFGGSDYEEGVPWAYTLSAVSWGSWTGIWPMVHARRAFSSMVYNNRIIACGGEEGGMVVNSCEIMNPESGSWAEYTPLAHMRSHHGMINRYGTVMVFGGYNEADNLTSTLDTLESWYDYSNMSWVAYYTLEEPCAGFVTVDID